MMHNDDRPIGRFLSRREALALFGASATASLAHRASAQVHRKRPSFSRRRIASRSPNRPKARTSWTRCSSDRTSGTIRRRAGSVAGAPLALQFVLSKVTSTGACAVLPGAQVDIWHCDALGVYSDVSDRTADTVGQQFLRGISSELTREGSFASTRSTPAGIAAERSTFTSRYACPETAAAPTSSRRSCTFPTSSPIACMRRSRMPRTRDSACSIPAT